MPRILLAATMALSVVGCSSPRSSPLSAGEKGKGAHSGEVRPLDLPKKEVIYCVAFSPDGRKVVAGTAGGRIWLWDTDKSKPLRNLKATSGDLLMGPVLCVAFSPDGTRLLAGCADHAVRLWDLATGKEIHAMKGHGGPVWSVAFFNDGKRALSGSTSDYTIREWDLEKGKELRQFNGQKRPDSLSISPDDRTFATTEFLKVQLWDLESGKVVRSFEGHELRVKAVFFTPDGSHIISGSADSIVKIWNLKTGKSMSEFGEGKILVESMAVSANGRRILLGKTNEMQLWDVQSGKKLKQFGKLSGPVRVAFSPDGRYALSGEMWGRVRLWELPKESQKREKRKQHSETTQ